MSFPEISKQIYLFIRMTANKFLWYIRTEIPILQDPGQESIAVGEIVVHIRIDHLR